MHRKFISYIAYFKCTRHIGTMYNVHVHDGARFSPTAQYRFISWPLPQLRTNETNILFEYKSFIVAENVAVNSFNWKKWGKNLCEIVLNFQTDVFRLIFETCSKFVVNVLVTLVKRTVQCHPIVIPYSNITFVIFTDILQLCVKCTKHSTAIA